METIIKVSDLCKSYDSGFEALKGINLNIHAGEIFALLGPNGAGKTTLISTVCGIVSPTSGSVKVSGYDIVIFENFSLATKIVAGGFPFVDMKQ